MVPIHSDGRRCRDPGLRKSEVPNAAIRTQRRKRLACQTSKISLRHKGKECDPHNEELNPRIYSGTKDWQKGIYLRHTEMQKEIVLPSQMSDYSGIASLLPCVLFQRALSVNFFQKVFLSGRAEGRTNNCHPFDFCLSFLAATIRNWPLMISKVKLLILSVYSWRIFRGPGLRRLRA